VEMKIEDLGIQRVMALQSGNYHAELRASNRGSPWIYYAFTGDLLEFKQHCGTSDALKWGPRIEAWIKSHTLTSDNDIRMKAAKAALNICEQKIANPSRAFKVFHPRRWKTLESKKTSSSINTIR